MQKGNLNLKIFSEKNYHKDLSNGSTQESKKNLETVKTIFFKKSFSQKNILTIVTMVLHRKKTKIKVCSKKKLKKNNFLEKYSLERISGNTQEKHEKVKLYINKLLLQKIIFTKKVS